MINHSEIPQPLSVMGTNVTPFETFEDVVHCISARIADKQKTFSVAINPEKVYRAMYDTTIAAALEEAELCICDGIGVTLAAAILHGRMVRRCTGSLLHSLIENAALNGWRVFLLGASADSNNKACASFLERYPNLQIVGHRDGYFQNSEEVIHQINESRADLLFVALGSPKQELWIAKHRHEITACFCMGVGGAFDIVSGKVKRAPKFLRKIGLEFLYRLIKQPKRFRRQLALPKFALMVLKEMLVTINK